MSSRNQLLSKDCCPRVYPEAVKELGRVTGTRGSSSYRVQIGAGKSEDGLVVRSGGGDQSVEEAI